MPLKTIFCRIFLLSACTLAFSNANAQDLSALTIGDSLTAGLSRTAGGTIRCAALGGAIIAANQQSTCKGNGQDGVGGWQPRLKQLTGSNTYNYGNSGERTSEMVGRLASHMAARSSVFVLIWGGTNDVIQRVSRGTTIANLQSMINAAKAAGRTPIVGTIPPLSGSRFGSLNGNVVSLNNEIRAISDVLVADHYAALAGNWGGLTSGDFIHLEAGNNVVADTWLQQMTFAPEPVPVSAYIPGVTDLLLRDE